MRTAERAWVEAVGSLGIDAQPRPRPNPAQWLWYAFWGPLPDRYRTWVLYDATCATWVLRHVARLLAVAALPVLAVVLFLPAPLGLRVLTAGVAGGTALLYTAVWINEATEYRLARAGWHERTAEEIRRRRVLMSAWMRRVRRLNR